MIRSTAICPPAGRWREWDARRADDPKGVERAAKQSMAAHVRAMLEFWRSRRADLRLRQQHPPDGEGSRASTDAFDFPGFVPAYVRPLFCRGIGPFRWAALSGDPEDIYRTDAKVKELMPNEAHLHNWLDMASAAHQVPGPAGAHLLGRARRPASAGPCLQRDGGERRTKGADRDRPRPPRFRLGRQPQPRDRGACRTAPTPCRTGRCSTRCSTAPRARPGCRSITAAASAWASRSTPAWSIVCDGTPEAARRHRARAVE